MTAIQVKDLSFSYTLPYSGGHHPRRNSAPPAVSGAAGAQGLLFTHFFLDVAAGKITALLGPNGSGKTTLLSLILGWLTPLGGSITFPGGSGGAKQDRGKLLGFVSQSAAAPFNFTVTEYTLLGRTPHLPPLGMPGESDRILVEAALEEAGISHLAERNIQELSAGELQLASIARCLAQQPAILLLDEPSSHLDPANTLSLLKLLRRLSATGMTILFTAHDPVFARTGADECVLLKKGELLAAGKVDELIRSDYLTRLYGVRFTEAPDPKGEMPRLDVTAKE